MLQKWQFVTECLSGDKRQTSDLKFRIFLAVGSITSVLFFFGGKKVDNHITKEALDGLGDFKVGGQIIQTVKYWDDLVLMAKEETVLQGMIDKLIETGRYYSME